MAGILEQLGNMLRDISDPLRHDNAEFAQQATNLVGLRRMSLTGNMAPPMCGVMAPFQSA